MTEPVKTLNRKRGRKKKRIEREGLSPSDALLVSTYGEDIDIASVKRALLWLYEIQRSDLTGARKLLQQAEDAYLGADFGFFHALEKITRTKIPQAEVVRLRFLRDKGIADVGSSDRSYDESYELIRPLLAESQQKSLGSFEDPIDFLRLEQLELNALPDDEFKALTIDAVLQAAEDRLSKQESEIQKQIDNGKELVAADSRLRAEVCARLQEQESRIAGLKFNLSAVRWQRRHPFQVEASEEGGAP